MLNFLNGWEHAAIWGVLIVLFERIMYCGPCVDDVVRIPRMAMLKKEFKDQWYKFYFIREACYGAGIFNNMGQEYLFNAIIHGINCSLIYHMSGSLLGSLLYLINPINNQTTIWCNGRRYALSILSVLIAWNWPLLGIVFYPFSMLIHSSAIFTPLLFLWSKYWLMTLCLIVIAAPVGIKQILTIIKGRKEEFVENNENQKLKWQKGILYVKSVGYHFINCLLPFKPAMYHNFLFYFSTTDKGNKDAYSFNFDFYKGVAVIGLLAYLIIFQHNFYAFWFLIFISPWCNIYQVTMNASDRYCSLANVGLMIGLAQYIEMIPSPFNWAAFAALSMLYIVKYIPLFTAYRSLENFYMYHIAIQPDLVDPRYHLAKLFLNNKDPYSAFAIVKKGLKYRPHDFKLSLAMMESMFAMGKNEQALKVMSFAEKYIPIGEEKETKDFFESIRDQFRGPVVAKGMNQNGKAMGIHIHNNGHPIVKTDVAKA